MTDGTVVVDLMGSKAKIVPIERISTSRSEVNGAVVVARYAANTVKSFVLSEDIPERVRLLGDSESTLASLENVTAVFGEYFGNRIG